MRLHSLRCVQIGQLCFRRYDNQVGKQATRRLTAQCIDPSAELNELREEVRQLESAAETSEDDAEDLREGMAEACVWIKRAIGPGRPGGSLNARPPGSSARESGTGTTLII